MHAWFGRETSWENIMWKTLLSMEDNIETDLRRIVFPVGIWINLAQDNVY
jgi:hypothetical protein